MQNQGSMRRVACALGLAGALLGCGSSASLEFAKGGTTFADAGDDSPYPDTATLNEDAGVRDTYGLEDAGPPCPPGKDGKSNVCVRVIRGSDAPSISADSKTAFGLDGKGAVMIGLAAVKPSGKDSSYVAMTWLPTESSSSGKFAASELPKVVEIAVEPGTYWAYAAFRDQEPYNRPGVAVGDYIPRLVELPQVTVVAEMGANVEVKVHPVRAIDLDVRMTTTPSGSGSGPLAAWLIEDKKIVGEGRVPCADLREGRATTIRVFTTYTGTFDIGAALFDFTSPAEDGMSLMPAFPAGTVHSEPPIEPVKIGDGDWLAPKRRIDLSAVVPTGTPKPTDASPGCATYASAPPM